jgi:hypothetical protein
MGGVHTSSLLEFFIFARFLPPRGGLMNLALGLWSLKITGTNGFCGRCAGKLKIKALPLRLDAAPLAVSKM